MNNYKEYFKDKKITQLGLGLLGRGLGDAIFLAECGAELIVTDLKTEEELKTSVEKLKGYPNITLHLGGHNLEDFKARDFILKGAGVPLDSIYIEEARKNNIPIEMDSSLFCKLLPKEVITIGVTGTRGKSTVTHLINHILKGVGKKTILGGNVRDMATLPLIKDIQQGVRPLAEIVVLELDSWQLQGFGDAKISPRIAIFTAFMHDHTNYYKSTPEMSGHERYFADKSNIYLYQKRGDTLVAGETISNVIASKPHGDGELTIARRSDVSVDWKPKIIGEHNVSNIACAIEACKAIGISIEDIKKGVESFLGVEGRLQFVKEINGVKIYNDNNATTPEATIAALKSLDTNIVLICGGSDKGLELNGLVEEINKTCKSIILLPGSGSDKLTILSTKVQNLSEAVTEAVKVAKFGDTILFSPAFASFGLFKNEYERNDEFMKIINEIKND
ncbi:MAG: UDP-N-acetylmuramoylalanine--D-glutamate ligase [Candidatus Taylorbacteria bacterium]|nr:UDP-N-acetylmuramoylalanine--D-glutamate ligase [Candidatus Taylorbacteria bacterium]